MSVSVDAQSGDLFSRVVSWWDTLGRKPNDPVEDLTVPIQIVVFVRLGIPPLGTIIFQIHQSDMTSASRRTVHESAW